MLPIKNCKPNNWKTREHNVVKLVEHIIVDGSATEETDPAKHPNRDNIQNVLIEHVQDKVGVSAIRLSSVAK